MVTQVREWEYKVMKTVKIEAHLELYSLQQSLKTLVSREKEGTAAHGGR